MAYSISKPLTFAAFMALGLAGCNNSSETAADVTPADGATTEAAANPNGTLQKSKTPALLSSVIVTPLFRFLISLMIPISLWAMRMI